MLALYLYLSISLRLSFFTAQSPVGRARIRGNYCTEKFIEFSGHSPGAAQPFASAKSVGQGRRWENALPRNGTQGNKKHTSVAADKGRLRCGYNSVRGTREKSFQFRGTATSSRNCKTSYMYGKRSSKFELPPPNSDKKSHLRRGNRGNFKRGKTRPETNATSTIRAGYHNGGIET